ncbi:hypothetical protein I302_104670 [Kwoniella bestiolae CBS 10118]|uniref:Short-chain dehydrogenase n=1 Tax=Kwoniella bestiolae CBS 10118 TaxID=1296100 RepID=A0A1B9FS49_9TREE|nr:hypothetical protein I302_09261 [Kwoniella bestiolae CBS 10118]OCF21582.1 hypothetical protein I302_09261 [Kwoniella bestiolae CBS 10118]
MSKIALILGLGPHIGQPTADRLLSAGYKVATVSRTPRIASEEGTIHLTADFQDPSTVEPVFDQVQQKWGSPSLVLYNAAAMCYTGENPLSAPIYEFINVFNVNTTSAYAAAALVYQRDHQVAFFYTGNALNSMIMLPLATAGVGKAATAHWVQAAAKSEALRPARFYYLDERNQQGGPAGGGISGEAHANVIMKLAADPEQRDPLVLFQA